ncbi:uncharacterized protein [Dysidea avara]|uniref:uncharacterized protein n=1 Tax=Dysidea avara TaxID=196820 RepID=UPI0033170718
MDRYSVNRLTPRQKRQIASLYGKAPKPVGTWEPLPSLTKAETEQVLKEYEQRMEENKTAMSQPQVHSNHPVERTDSSNVHNVPRHTSSVFSSNFSNVDYSDSGRYSPSIQRSGVSTTSGPRRPVTDYITKAQPSTLPPQHYMQAHSSTLQTGAPPNRSVYQPSSNVNWTEPHQTKMTGVRTSQVHSMQPPSQATGFKRSSSPNIPAYTQPVTSQYPSSNWRGSSNRSISSSNVQQYSQVHSMQQPSFTTDQRRASSPHEMRSIQPPSTASNSNWSDNYSSHLMPAQSTSSHNNQSSTHEEHQTTSDSHCVSQLSTDLTSLGITLKLSSIEDMSNVDYSLLVVGVTGSGKSSTCNFFIGENVFETEGGAIAVTAKSDAHVQTILGKRVLFIDTPGFGDEFASDEVRMAELGRAILFAKDGVNAIVLCLDGSRRFDSSVANLLKEFEVLGAFWPYTFILYTHSADMGHNEEERKCKITEWLNHPKCPERMKWLFNKVSHRTMTVESKHYSMSTSYYQDKCQELLHMIEVISAHNHYQRYTNQFFQWAKKKYDHVKQQKIQHERQLKETQRSLWQYQSFVQDMEGDLHRKDQQYTDTMRRQQQYIYNLESQLRSCRDDERMKYQRHVAEVQQQMDQSRQEHQHVVSDHYASKEKMLAKYNEDSKQVAELESQSKKEAVDVFLDELRYELMVSNQERRELRDKVVYMDARLQMMQEEKGHQHKQENSSSSMSGMMVEGAKIMLPTVGKAAAKWLCSIM